MTHGLFRRQLEPHLSPPRPSPCRPRRASCKAAGRDIIVLSAGEPDFDTPENIKQAAIKALARGQDQVHRRRRHPRAQGGDRRASSSARTGSTTSRARSRSAPAASRCIYNALLATLNPGDEVVIPAPCWVSYADIVHARRRQAGVRRDAARGRLPAEAGGARRGHHAEDQVARSSTRPRTRRAPPIPRTQIKALTDVLHAPRTGTCGC